MLQTAAHTYKCIDVTFYINRSTFKNSLYACNESAGYNRSLGHKPE